ILDVASVTGFQCRFAVRDGREWTGEAAVVAVASFGGNKILVTGGAHREGHAVGCTAIDGDDQVSRAGSARRAELNHELLIPEIGRAPSVVGALGSDYAQAVQTVPGDGGSSLRSTEEISVQGDVRAGRAAHILAAGIWPAVQIREKDLGSRRLRLQALRSGDA